MSCLLALACGDVPSPTSSHVGRDRGADGLDAGVLAAGDGAAEPASHSRRFPACARAADNAVTDVFCAPEPPQVEGLVDLQRQLGLEVAAVAGGRTLAVLLGHSTALSGHLVSSINPRAILMDRVTAVAFQRGVQRVEIAARGRTDRRLRFYLVTFEQACNERADGCSPGELYTPQVERGWRSVKLLDDEDLKDTPADCRQCHQRALEEPVLLMRELEAPWTHFFGPNGEPSDAPRPAVEPGDLLRDYRAAWGDVAYGGLPSGVIGSSFGFLLQAVVPREQPLLFDAAAIFDERWPWHPEDGYPARPRRSETWDRAYAGFKRGENLPLPYFGERATDPVKLAALAEAYAQYRFGERSVETLPDLADIFPDDPQVRAEIGLQTEPGATPVEALIQACGPCHNDVLDQEVSRARFNIALAGISADERMLAIERIQRARHEPGVMPPPEARALDAEARASLTRYLARQERAAEDDAMLAEAARLGMAGDGVERTASEPP